MNLSAGTNIKKQIAKIECGIFSQRQRDEVPAKKKPQIYNSIILLFFVFFMSQLIVKLQTIKSKG